jgi:MYXO-CTERM domain-containing protein
VKTPGDGEAAGARAFRLAALAVFLLALALRVGFQLGVQVDGPVAGDIVQYVAYAWNLVHHGTFSSALPDSAAWPPDAFRGPGYPAFLALWLWLAGDESFLAAATAAQLVLGAATAPLAIAWTRQWLPRGGALAVGGLVAAWPHSIVFSATLLNETLFAFALVAFLALAGRAARTARPGAALIAGVAGGLATLVNPIALVLAPLAAALTWRHGRRLAALLLAGHVAVVGAWSLRNAMHPGMPGASDRAALNLVEGSWPLYHAAYHAQREQPLARKMMVDIAAEERLMVADPAAGLAAVATRVRAEPVPYVVWYALRKPWLLWSWKVAIGWGDVYFLATRRSPFETQWPYRALHAACRAANPALFALAVLAAGLAWRRRPGDAAQATAWRLAAMAFLYVTAVHVVLQAEPRYAVAYRPIEFALAVTGALAAWRALRSRLRPGPAPAPA